jgi:diguanylate cyclase
MAAFLPIPNAICVGETMFNRDPKHTMEIARTALDHIATLGLPADPQSFAVWYSYAAAQFPQINHQINLLLSGESKLSVTDIDRIAEQHFSPLAPAAQIDKIGADLTNEVDRIVDRIEAVTGNATAYQAELADAHRKLDRAANRDSIRALIQTVVEATKTMEQRNQALETALRVSKQVIENLQKDVESIRGESLRDPLTSLGNRKHFELMLAEAIDDVLQRQAGPFSLLFIDIDYFKQFNDSYGHQVGDDVLRLLSQHLKAFLKGQDVAARYGGEEFAVLLPGTSLEQAKLVAENLRATIAGKVVRKRTSGESLGQITVSIGVAEFRVGEGAEELIGRADTALYAAKRTGRNVVSC